ncbi:MAG: chromate resistance protein [Verrucomicrobia bacterium]|nr:chromate resistance protein [Verrucomicrobiota bacterium]
MRQLIAGRKRPKGTSGRCGRQLNALRQRFEEIRAIDYFECSRGEDVQRLLEEGEALQQPKRAPESRLRLRPEAYQGRTWVTWPRPQIDRVGSAWLIRNFIDPGARFVFAARAEVYPDALPYGIAGAESGRRHDLCTFQTFGTIRPSRSRRAAFG